MGTEFCEDLNKHTKQGDKRLRSSIILYERLVLDLEILPRKKLPMEYPAPYFGSLGSSEGADASYHAHFTEYKSSSMSSAGQPRPLVSASPREGI